MVEILKVLRNATLAVIISVAFVIAVVMAIDVLIDL